MISICIPVYNYDIRQLIAALSVQVKHLRQPFEIILIDDASSPAFRAINKSSTAAYTYIELANNIGRAKIRNLFLQHAKYPYLLFMDCDVIIDSPDYLSDYLSALSLQPSVLCGGLVYPDQAPARVYRLRWKNGKRREERSLKERRSRPGQSFMTSNFLIERGVFEKIRFDERISTYGHEDTLFGYALKKENIAILHIDNPVLIGDLETNKQFLRKTNEAVMNLADILKKSGHDEELIADISLLGFYNQVKSFRWMIVFLFWISRPVLTFFLERGYVNLKAFDLYKLGLLAMHMKT